MQLVCICLSTWHAATTISKLNVYGLTLCRQADNVWVIEQVEQKVFNIVQCFRAAQIQQQHTNFVCSCRRLLQIDLRQAGLHIPSQGSRVGDKAGSCSWLLPAESYKLWPRTVIVSTKSVGPYVNISAYTACHACAAGTKASKLLYLRCK